MYVLVASLTFDVIMGEWFGFFRIWKIEGDDDQTIAAVWLWVCVCMRVQACRSTQRMGLMNGPKTK